MGWVVMSERDVRRIEVLSEVVSGRRTITAAALVLAMTPRHVRRLLARLQTGGGVALAHKARGRPPNNRIDAGIRDYALALVRDGDEISFDGPSRTLDLLISPEESLLMRMITRGEAERRTCTCPPIS